MRFPVFARGANPRVDLPIVRKSMAYLEVQVTDLLASWVDGSDHRAGIIAREFLPSGKQLEIVQDISALAFPREEVRGVKFVEPTSDQWKIDHRSVTFAESA